jgi:hypothetical protein
MTRAVLVGEPTGRWKLYRQAQWMPEVRRNPAAATWPKRYFDLEESAYLEALANWEDAAGSLEAALERLQTLGANEIIRP